MEDASTRRRTMQAVKGQNTGLEMTVRRLMHGMGYRYRLHRKDLPGKPDLTFPGYRKVIFVHGCFWHGHDCKRGARIPKNNREYWISKICRNRERDSRNIKALEQEGWKVAVIWECQVKNKENLRQTIKAFMKTVPKLGAMRVGSA